MKTIETSINDKTRGREITARSHSIMKWGTTALCSVLLGGAILGMTGCAPKAQVPVEAEKAAMTVMETVLAGAWRGDAVKRDQFRHPAATLEFFGVKPGQKIVEIAPGSGWYSDILAPYAKATGGTFIAAGVRDYYVKKISNVEVYGAVETMSFGRKSPALPVTDADLVLSFRSIHNFISAGMGQKAFDDFYAALKPGGILGVVEHRLPESREQDLRTSSGYVQVSFTKALAAKAGFEFVGASEINANPKDTADHPFGVWTLPPVSMTAPRGKEANSEFDGAPYLMIGESDRYTLKFKKPE